MATNINYPAVNLPCPLLSGNTYQPGTTFIRSEFDYAIRQRKQYCAQYSVGFSFIIKSQIQMETFKDFFYNTLNYGVNSFLADWEIEGMDGIKEFRFSSNYTTVALGANRYRITASFDMITKIKGLFVIPSIQYSMDIISTELNGTRYIKNDGKGGNSFNAEAFASNHIYLNGKSVPYPVLHDLGNDEYEGTIDCFLTDSVLTDLTGGDWNLEVAVTPTSTSYYTSWEATSAGAAGEFFELEFTAIINSGELTFFKYYDGTQEVLLPDGEHLVTEGVNRIRVPVRVGHTRIASLYVLAGDYCDIDFTNNTLKEITLPTASYLTYFYSTANTLTELSSTGDVGENIYNTIDLDGTGVDRAVITDGYNLIYDGLSSSESVNYIRYDLGAEDVLDREMTLSFNAKINSGTLTYTHYYDGSGFVVLPNGSHTVANGLNTIQLPSPTGSNGNRMLITTNIAQAANIDMTDISIVAGVPVSTTYSVTDSHQFVFNHTAPLEDIDVSALEVDPDLAFRMLHGEVLPSGFSNTDVGWFSGGNEGLASAEKVYDLSDQAFLTYVSIVDYDAATRTTLANQSNGASNLKLIRDSSGRTTGIAAANTTQWEADGRTAVTNWTITAPFTITEPINGDTYTFTSDGNRYKNTVADGTYTLPTGVWTLDEFGFDGVTSVTARGVTKKVNEIVVP